MNKTIYIFALSALIFSACKKKVDVETIVCEDSCIPFNNDGECDDGGEGSTSDLCKIGTDCSDCGERLVITTIKVKRKDLPKDSIQ